MTDLDDKIVTKKQKQELDFVQRFLTDAGLQYTSLVSSDKPDNRAIVEGRNIGIEVSVFHADEGVERKSNQDSLRQAGERIARIAPNQPYTMEIPTSSYAGLEARINDKITKAVQYDMSRIDELWLLIPAQQPTHGALPATFVIPFFVDVNELNHRFHARLVDSSFNRVYWHMIHDHAIYGWNRSTGWHVVRQENEPDKTGLEVLNRIRQRQTL